LNRAALTPGDCVFQLDLFGTEEMVDVL